MPPEKDTVKLNADGAFVNADAAGAGMVLRDHAGNVILAACRKLDHCNDATEAELAAIEDGLQLALQWTTLPVMVETDCAVAAKMIKEKGPNNSIYAFRIKAIRELIQERGSKIDSISHDVNEVSHELAKLGRVQARTEVWLGDFPPEIALLVAKECKPGP